jgi:hypothetical protein
VFDYVVQGNPAPAETGSGKKKEERMKRSIVFSAVVCIALLLTPAVNAQTTQLMQGTQIRLVLLNGLSTSVAHDGDPFLAQVAEPVFLGGQLILPAGAKVHGVVGSVVRRNGSPSSVARRR